MTTIRACTVCGERGKHKPTCCWASDEQRRQHALDTASAEMSSLIRTAAKEGYLAGVENERELAATWLRKLAKELLQVSADSVIAPALLDVADGIKKGAHTS